jgi:hypothetical protein
MRRFFSLLYWNIQALLDEPSHLFVGLVVISVLGAIGICLMGYAAGGSF